ncbi:hypothetical protein [Clostridium saccharobutylicum]|uniref:Uncharacterized protein n=1 Tax=Clostridium saccharobutylicum DSM 13864 TaxID=1345695 RepID=U5MX67_CLOSA|nr:hypothetical protein [Clostridium saccharobutylicum]AGX44226.1 hypothetical protein CLSA_c32620 [Clostridium saccharobutylicum DSM 13864]AQR91515.1 hypothetical protein CLOSC_32410 [Clostridium saccharobutylicum]AQS01420.1 hypothetical protein CSACC_32490 [Clostridium saccharobutylicum]AQS11029.1 hypothetical protein CLOBY_31790 [Clostridium saccharobutylicum]AQS15403.1 hypothetical protein CLOSACC_32490 [Clostridium saccharobutylicum]
MELKKENANLYDQFLKYSYTELKELFDKAKTKDEQDFYMNMANLVLQREQKRVIKEMPV